MEKEMMVRLWGIPKIDIERQFYMTGTDGLRRVLETKDPWCEDIILKEGDTINLHPDNTYTRIEVVRENPFLSEPKKSEK